MSLWTVLQPLIEQLTGDNLKKQGILNYRAAGNPTRPGSDSHGFTIKLDPDENDGVWYDHADGSKGRLAGENGLAHVLGIPYAEHVGNKGKQSKAATTAKEWLAQHGGLKLEDAKSYGIKVEKRDLWSHKKGEVIDGLTCLVFPSQDTIERLRILQDARWSGPTWKPASKGSTPQLWGLGRALKKPGPLVLCNGQGSTMAAQHYNIPAFCLTDGETKRPTAEQLAEIKATGRQVLLTPDNDETGQVWGAEWSQLLTDAGISHKVVSLKGTTPGFDLADLCTLYTDGSRAVLESYVPKEDSKELSIAVLGSPSGSVASRLKDMIYERAMNPSEVPGISTGFEKLDRATGGMERGNVYTILGDTGVGKSTLLSSMTSNILGLPAAMVTAGYKHETRAIIATTEMPGPNWMRMLVCRLASTHADIITVKDLRTGWYKGQRLVNNKTVYGRILQALDTLDNLGDAAWWIEKVSPTPEDLRKEVDYAMARYPYEFLIVDSLSNFSGADNIYQRVTDAANMCLELAIAHNLVCLNVVQVGRKLTGRKVMNPTLHDAEGSASVEKNASVVLGLHVPAFDIEGAPRLQKNRAELHSLKDRLGDSTGKKFDVDFVGGTGYYDTSQNMLMDVVTPGGHSLPYSVTDASVRF